MSTAGFLVLLVFMWWLFGPVGVLLVFVAVLIIALLNAGSSALSALWPPAARTAVVGRFSPIRR